MLLKLIPSIRNCVPILLSCGRFQAMGWMAATARLREDGNLVMLTDPAQRDQLHAAPGGGQWGDLSKHLPDGERAAGHRHQRAHAILMACRRRSVAAVGHHKRYERRGGDDGAAAVQ